MNDLHKHAHVAYSLPIVVDDVYKSFGNVKALKGVSLTVQPGTIMALLGPNGAGKTTLIRIMTTIIKPDEGRVYIGGHHVIHDADMVRKTIGLAGQSVAIDEILTGRENLELVGRLYHLGSRQAKIRAQELLEEFNLVDAADRILKTYSGGMRRRLDLAVSLIAKPKVLFLDEPTSGLDPQSRTALWQTINQLVQNGTTILLTTQYMEEADHLADQIAVIDKGELIAFGTADELKSQAGGDVVEVHLQDHNMLSRVAHILSDLSHVKPREDKIEGKVIIQARQGIPIMPDIVRRLDQEKIQIENLSLRRPTLDDVFIKLTGHGTQESQRP